MVESESYETASVDTFFGGAETGVSTTKVICGDISKHISVYVTKASQWWKFREYKFGIQINSDDGGIAIEIGAGEASTIISRDNSSVEVVVGINKIGATQKCDVDFGKRTAGTYYHLYARTIPVVAIAVAAYYTGGAAVVPALQAAFAR